jgi:GNAT superfamily N-acetyltransferase
LELPELQPEEFARISGLLEPLDYNLSLLCLLAGEAPGRVFVDDPARPASALVELKYHLFLAGEAANPDFNRAARQLMTGTLQPLAQKAGRDAFLVHGAGPAWEEALPGLLAGLPFKEWLRRLPREYYTCTSLHGSWRERLPEGFSLLPVDAELVMQEHLKNIDTLLEEMCSERPTVDDFLARSFGFCLRWQDEIVSWCLSEYNTGPRCEVGIATVEEYQRRGLGTVTALALVEHALNSGISEVGWHCWTRNTASGALARKAGFVHRLDYTVDLCIF